MPFSRRTAPLFALVALGLAATPAAHAQSYTLTTLHSFTDGDGSGPFGGLTLGSGGVLYGTTETGGSRSYGTIFSYDTASGAFNSLYSLTISDGAGFGILTVGTGNTLYGISGPDLVGANGYGAVFSYNSATGEFTTLHTITRADGIGSAGFTVGGGSLLYGTANGSGADSNGTLFSFDTTTNTYTVLHNFTGGTDGSSPYANLTVGSDGSFYGATRSGGANNDGTLFSYNPASGILTTLYNFTTADGTGPVANLVLGSDGTLYGTTSFNGASGGGTLFSYNPTSGALTTLHSFDSITDVHGSSPWPSLSLHSGVILYGTTSRGGDANNDGTAFSYNLATGAFTTIAAFNGADGSEPGSLTLGPGDILYGTTSYGGADNDGTVFALVPRPRVVFRSRSHHRPVHL